MKNIPKKLVIVDTDMGCDDAIALLYLSSCKDVEIVALTLVPGCASIEITVTNAKRILTFLKKKNVPVFRGEKFNLFGDKITGDKRYGSNGMADVDMPKEESAHQTDMASSQALVHYARKFPKSLHVLCLGPLTNLAVASLIDSEFASLLASVTISGSDRSRETLKNKTIFAEFNAWCDPAAYKLVLNTFNVFKLPLRVVDWSFCCKNLIPSYIIEKIVESCKNPTNQRMIFLSKFIDQSNPIIKKNYRSYGFIAPDLLTALVFDDPKIFLSRKVKLENIELTGHQMGHTVYKDCPNGFIELVTRIDGSDWVDKLLEKFLCPD